MANKKKKYKSNLGGRRDFSNSPARVRSENKANGHQSAGDHMSSAYNKLSLPKRPYDRFVEAHEKRAAEQQGSPAPRRSGGSLLQIREGTKRKQPKHKRPPTPTNR